MNLVVAQEAWLGRLYRQKQNRKMVERINRLIQEVKREPFAGVGKLEPLNHALAGFWSRRINDEHRMVYRVEEDALFIAQRRYHYLISVGRSKGRGQRHIQVCAATNPLPRMTPHSCDFELG